MADMYGTLPLDLPLTKCISSFWLTQIQHYRSWRPKFTAWNLISTLTGKIFVKNLVAKDWMRAKQLQHLVWKTRASCILKYSTFYAVFVVHHLMAAVFLHSGFGTTNCMEDSVLDWICWPSVCLCMDLYKTLALLWGGCSQPAHESS